MMDDRRSADNQDDERKWLEEVYRQMFFVAYSRMKNKADALDVVQESWVRILSKMNSLREPHKLIPWAKTIVNHTALNIIKRKMLERGKYEDYAVKNHLLRMTLREEELASEVKGQLDHLEDDMQALIVYKYFYGYKDHEIADALQLPVGTVKIRIHRCREKLKRMLEGEQDSPKKKST
ncbi:RNA polymerase sigma factor [Marinicrinis lubricantis]|uniref:RNA polymerase sigma factor n=1 Tax=Marinicrinis lubricantis TaxID=2086470 RepID=A0ABW1ILM4_9BACL